ncbi:MAG TPA: T9SS type A sorting domain-containing protein, partial [Catalimonadaceae bacterium]|nr:T9SS type A sorting domain-containing protein [Catalimonadaceae bacterium]
LPAVFASGTISVAAVNGCGQSTAKSLAIKSVTGTPGVITGPSTNLCGGGTFVYSVAAVTGALSYNWTAPAGCSIDVNGGNSISLTIPSGFTTGTLSVSAVNACGNSTARNLALKSLPAQPGIISGSNPVCPGATDLIYSTTQIGSLTYNWTVPTGASVSAGQGSNQISANWGSVAGNVTVKAVNACGISPARSLAVALAACRSAQNGELDDVLIPSASVYPNPGTGLFNIEMQNLTGTSTLKVYNLNGVLIAEQKLDGNLKNQTVNLESQPTGIYLIQILSEGFHKEIRVVKH